LFSKAFLAALAFPAFARFSTTASYFPISVTNLLCEIDPPETVKNSMIVGFMSDHSPADSLVSADKRRSSRGSFPPARHIAIRSNRYAPCSAVVRCVVSPW